MFLTSSGLPELRVPVIYKVYPTVHFTLGRYYTNQRKCMPLRTYILMEDRVQLIIIQTRIKNPLVCTKHYGKLKKSGSIDEMVKRF